ncbi:unnamed protein product [Thelazia callipaeda]|uniref:E3 ubiquitin-protein transferase MAEA n=1 Tax=Thelazia callipaeda TaxID=103827 RepID=A0A0N5CK99_THECL|nr:unnamed protein product [Thelazia callipaeda]
MSSSSGASQDSSSGGNVSNQGRTGLYADEISAIEYATLKVPYELLNKCFRSSQKALEKNNQYLKERAESLMQSVHSTSEVIRKRRVTKLISEEEFALIDLLKMRLNHLQKADTCDLYKKEIWRSQRISRLIIDYLLRSGYFETAQKLSEQAHVEYMCNKNVFMISKQALQVEHSLSRHETDRCLEWITENRSKLRRLKSPLETTIRLQDCIEMVRRGERLQAVHYVRKFLSNLPKDQWSDQVVKVMGLIGFGNPVRTCAYSEYFSEKRWDQLIDLFRQENARVYKLMEYSPFNACLCLGLSAYKSPQCRPDLDSHCPTCRPDLFELAEDLPHSHASNSKLMCSYSGEQIGDNNEPYMLPNGYVFGSKSIEKLINSSEEIVCPKTGEIYSANQLMRLFVL